MKQKRKVKSLLPKKNFVNGRFLTILLVVLSLILCVWSVSLLTHSVLAQWLSQWQHKLTINYWYSNLWRTITGQLKQPHEELLLSWNIYNVVTPQDIYYTGYGIIVSGMMPDYDFERYVYYTPISDRNDDWIADQTQWHKLYILYEDSDWYSVVNKYFSGTLLSWDEYEVRSPKVSFFLADKDVVTGVIRGEGVTTIITVTYYPDSNENGIPDKDEYTITMNYTCKLCGRKEYECNILQKTFLVPKGVDIQTSQDNVSFPWYKVEYIPWTINPQWNGEYDIIVKLTPERDQNNDCVYDWEQEIWEITEFYYTWLDNKVEVLYGMRFVDPSNFRKVVNNIYVSGSSLYITPNPVIVNSSSNKVDNGVYSHILWWSDNEVSSKNITMIAWSNNKVHDWNDNASILGWKGNKIMPWEDGWVPAILVGWESNVMGTWHNGNALIWWKNNRITEWWASDFILWWENNLIQSATNNIIWWRNVHVVGIDNIFVYSNRGGYDAYFSPISRNAFYLNVEGGVWINTGWVEWLSVGGAVSIGKININVSCNTGNLWVIWSYNGCLVWCTKAWMNDSKKWEMLDQWKGCAAVCKNNPSRCLNQEDAEGVEVNDSDAQCTTWVVDTENAHLCIDDLWSYKNVIFETSLIDSDTHCPNNSQDICVYQCNSGYHLRGIEEEEKFKCYADCEFIRADWNKQILHHNDTVDWYNSGQVYCSNNEYIFPTSPQRSPETCVSHGHKKTLICKAWHMYIKDSSYTNWFNPSEELAKTYKYPSCNLYDYRCDTSETGYNLTQDQISGILNDGPQDGNWIVADRGRLQWIRWKYKLCIDYNAADNKNDRNPANPTLNWTFCDTGSVMPKPAYHYKFLGCNTETHDLIDGKCMKKCSLIWSGGSPKYKHGSLVTGFKDDVVACPGECTWVQLLCDDGSWKLNWSVVTWYYNDCSNGGKQCDSSYNLTGGQQKSWWVYVSCISYKAGTCEPTTRYKLDKCEEWYHLVWWECVSNTHYEPCQQKGAPANAHYITGNVEVTWEDSWNGGSWSAAANCKWACNEGYATWSDGQSCVLAECWDEVNTCKNGIIATWIWSDDSHSWWDCGNITCFLCNTGYHQPNCEKDVENKCDNSHPYGCLTWVADDRNTPDNVTFTWDCLGIPPEEANSETGCHFECSGSNKKWDFNMNSCVCEEWYYENENNECVQNISIVCGVDKFTCDGGEPTNTGHFDGRYVWECGDELCTLNDDGSKFNVCRDVEYGICGGTEGVQSMEFRVSWWMDTPEGGIIQNFDYNVLYQNWYFPVYDTVSCSWLWIWGRWDRIWCDWIVTLEVEDGFSYSCTTPVSPEWYYPPRWLQYLWGTGLKEVIFKGANSENYNYIGDCGDKPKCWNSENTCASWSSAVLYNSGTQTWYCSNDFNVVKCQMECEIKCPAGYKPNDNWECVLDSIEYCARWVSDSEFIGNCQMAWDDWYTPIGWFGSNTCCGSEEGAVFWGSFGPWPKDNFSVFSECLNNFPSKVFYSQDDYRFNGVYYLIEHDEHTCANYGELVLNACFDKLHKYSADQSDNWYYIDDCLAFEKVDRCSKKCSVHQTN